MPTDVAIASSRVGNVNSRKGARTHGGLPMPDNHRRKAATERPLDRPAGPARSLEGGCTGFALMYAISTRSVRRQTKGLARVEPGRALTAEAGGSVRALQAAGGRAGAGAHDGPVQTGRHSRASRSERAPVRRHELVARGQYADRTGRLTALPGIREHRERVRPHE